MPPLYLDALYPERVDGILVLAQACALDVGLDYDSAVSVSLMFLEELHATLEIDRVNDASILDHCCGIHPGNVFPNGQARSG